MSANDFINFLEHFEDLEDPRSERNQLHSMPEILLLTLCAAICGAEGWQDVEDFGEAKIDFLKKFFPYKHGIPSDDTCRRFFRALDPEKFQELFRAWVQSFQLNLQDEIIAIDGKSSRHSFDHDKAMLHMVSAYATKTGLVLAQEKVSNKSNEITAIPKVLEWLDLKGNTVTIDAMGCQYKIADQIIEQEGNYIFGLKGNQGVLNEAVRTYFEAKNVREFLDIKSCEDVNKGHGRLETRKCEVSHNVAWLQEQHPKWKTVKSLIRIESIRDIKGKLSHETRYYISSLKETPEKMLESIRSHWGIENELHWVLDMSFGEDACRIRKDNAPQIMSTIRHIAFNLLKLQKSKMKRQSVKRLRKMAGWDDQLLKSIISQKFS